MIEMEFEVLDIIEIDVEMGQLLPSIGSSMPFAFESLRSHALLGSVMGTEENVQEV